MLIYKIITSKSGFKELEDEISLLINKGWKPIGGIAFNQGFPYQAMVGKTKNTIKNQKDKKSAQDLKHKREQIGAVDGMKKIDELT